MARIKTVKHRVAMDLAFRGLGGVPALIEWGKEHPGEFYRLWMQGARQESKVDHTHRVVLLTPEEREARVRELLAPTVRELANPEQEVMEVSDAVFAEVLRVEPGPEGTIG